jgi:hypothetical protein
MKDLLALALAIVFSALAAIHFYWALGGTAGKSAATPPISSTYAPSSLGMLGVALYLLVSAAVLLSVSGAIVLPLSPRIRIGFSYMLALSLLLRAIGDFRFIGFFKRVQGTRFAQCDTFLLSPLALVLAISVFVLAYAHAA